MTRNTARPAEQSGTFAIGGDLPVHRLGYGAMQLTGPASGARPRTPPRPCACCAAPSSWA
jgi:hypothetical protein